MGICCIIISIIGKTVARIIRRLLRLVVRLLRESVPLRLMARIPIEAQVDINFTKEYIYVIFQIMLLFCIDLGIMFRDLLFILVLFSILFRHRCW